MTTVGDEDLVLGALGSLGTRLDCTGLGRLDLAGLRCCGWSRPVPWTCVRGGRRAAGHWHHLGRLEAGTLLLGPVAGPQHTLVARPVRDCVVHRVNLRELYQPAQTQTWSRTTSTATRSTCRRRRARWSTPPHWVSAAACPCCSRRPWPRSGPPLRRTDDVFWMQVPPGSVQYGSLYGAEAAADLLMDPALWQSVVDQQYRLLTALDRWIEQLERTHETRTAAGIKAGEAVPRPGRPDPAGLDRQSLGTPYDGRRRRRHLRGLPAGRGAAGIRLAEPAQSGTESDRLDPVERVALASRVRTRAVRLDGRWWRENVGPLVGPPGAVRGAGRAAVAARRLCRRPPRDGARDARREGERGGVRAARGDVLPAAARGAPRSARAAAVQPARHPRRPAEPAARGAGDGGDRRAGCRSRRARCSASTCRGRRRA